MPELLDYRFVRGTGGRFKRRRRDVDLGRQVHAACVR